MNKSVVTQNIKKRRRELILFNIFKEPIIDVLNLYQNTNLRSVDPPILHFLNLKFNKNVLFLFLNYYYVALVIF